jgi:hypothetical protein
MQFLHIHRLLYQTRFPVCWGYNKKPGNFMREGRVTFSFLFCDGRRRHLRIKPFQPHQVAPIPLKTLHLEDRLSVR